MNDDSFKKVCALLNLGNIVSPPIKVIGGLLHLTWRLKTTRGEYAFKELNKYIVVNNKIKNSYEITEKIAYAFSKNDISAVVSLKDRNNKALIEVGEKIFIVYPWINGTTLGCDEISGYHAKSIASILARMHTLNLQFPQLLDPKWDIHENEFLKKLIERTNKIDLPYAKYLQENLTNIISWNKLYQESIPLLNNNLIISHGDLDQKNIIWGNDLNPILIDWESARLLNPTQEILNAALDWSGITSGKVNLKIFEAMLYEYKLAGGKINMDQVNPALWAIMGNWLNWLKYNIERSLGEHISTEEERELGIKQVEISMKILIYLSSNVRNLYNLI